MDEKSLAEQISQLMSQTPASQTGPGKAEADEPKDDLAERLMSVPGQADESLESALNDFLGSRGVLSETTRAALLQGGSGLDDIIALLVKQFKLSPAAAKMIASLIKNLQPSGGSATAAKKKPRRKAKAKESAAKKKPAAKEQPSAKKKPAAKKRPAAKKQPGAKKPLKKTAAKPKKAAARPTAKKKPAPKTRPGSARKPAAKTTAKAASSKTA